MIMYKYSIFFFCVCAASVGMYSSEDSQYLRAHTAYAQGNYQEVINLLSNLPENSFPIVYNLGWAQYKNGNYYQAMKLFLKAMRIGSCSDRLRAYTLYEQMQDKLALPLKAGKYTIFLMRIFLSIPTFLIQLLSLIMVLLTLVCIMYRRKWFVCLIVALSAAFCTAGLYYRYTELTKTIALANKEKVAVYTGPDDQYGIVEMVPLGTHFSVVSTQKLWYCVGFNKQRGWVHTQDLDLIT